MEGKTEPAAYRDPLLALNDEKVKDPAGYKLRGEFALKILCALIGNRGGPVVSVGETELLINQAVQTTDKLFRKLADTDRR